MMVLLLAADNASAEKDHADRPAAIVSVERDGDTFLVHASADLPAAPRVAWDTITDYERLPQFVPGISRSHVLSRAANGKGERLVVDHAGVLHFLLFSRPVRVRLLVEQEPYTKVVARAGGSDTGAGSAQQADSTVRVFTARYDLTVIRSGGGSRAGVRLTYGAEFVLSEPLPSWIGAWPIRQSMRDQFEAMLAEIMRRQAARPAIEWSSDASEMTDAAAPATSLVISSAASRATSDATSGATSGATALAAEQTAARVGHASAADPLARSQEESRN